MKFHLNSFSKYLAIASLLAFGLAGPVVAQKKKPVAKPVATPKFSDISEKLTFDHSPASSEGGVVTSYAPALEKVMPAVVTVFSSKEVKVTRNRGQEEMFRRMFPDIPEDFFDRQERRGGREQGLGSGVIITEDGYILTNNHVVKDADEIKVSLSRDKKEYQATLVGADPNTDVALIKIEAKGLTTISIGDSARLKIGDVAIAIGNPLGLEQTATMGIISALGRSDLRIIDGENGMGGYENFIQTDASINRGNSGGALVDANGRLIGINTAIQSNFGGNIGIGFAIPSNMALNIVQKLLDGGGTVKRGFLGVLLREPDENIAKALGRDDQSGVLIAEVGTNGPGDRAGLKAADLIVGFNGKKVDSMAKLRLAISNTAPGTEVEFEIVRGGKTIKKKAVLADLEDREKIFAMGPGGSGSDDPAVAKPIDLIEGVRITDLNEETRGALELDDDFHGVLVEGVDDDSPGAKAGLRPGLVITQIDQKPVTSVKDAHDIVGKVESDYVLIQVYVNGRRDVLAVELKK